MGLLAIPARSADLPFLQPPASPSFYRWDGAYLGVNVGYAFGASDYGIAGFPPQTFAGLTPTSASATGNGVIGGLQAGYLQQIDAFVFGFEQDVILGMPSGTVQASGVASGLPFGLRGSQDVHWITTTRGRIGFAPNDSFMVYASAGLALGGVNTKSSLTFGNGLTFTASDDDVRTGWAAGIGIEYAITPQLSAVIDYLHFDLGHTTVVGLPNAAADFETHTGASLRGDIVRAGVNYRFDHDDITFVRDFGGLIPQAKVLETEFGLRYWYSTGTLGKNLFDLGGSAMVSRLTYTDLTAGTAEGFARVDDRSTGIFVKGFVGAGGIGSGSLKDEDFPPTISPYSATTSGQHDGSLLYVSGDVGYDVLWTPRYRVSPFVGIFADRERVNAYGCTQIAGNPDVCAPAIADSMLAITEDARWLGMRVGVSGQVTLWDRLTLGLDAAWLPLLTMTSTDSHWLRMEPTFGNFTGPIPEDGNGNTGFQLEAIASYALTPCFNLGLGARYWRLAAHGTAHFEGDTYGDIGGPQPVNFVSERYGVFTQGAFKF